MDIKKLNFREEFSGWSTYGQTDTEVNESQINALESKINEIIDFLNEFKKDVEYQIEFGHSH